MTATEEQRHRARLVLTIFPALCALTIYLVISQVGFDTLRFRYNIIPESLVILEILLIVTSFASAILWYLQTGFKKFGSGDTENQALVNRHNRDHDRTLQMAVRQIEYLEFRLSSLSETIDEISSRSELNDPNDPEIIGKISQSLIEDAGGRVLSFVRNKVENEVRDNLFIESIQEVFYQGGLRLSSEISALMRRGNLNLVLGALTTLTGIGLLGYFVVNSETKIADPKIFAMHYLPKITLIIFIQVFAFFFLKLYKESLDGIKFFQNEITNLEHKYIALIGAKQYPDSDIIDIVIKSYANTDRNTCFQNQTEDVKDKKLVQLGLDMVEKVVSRAEGKP